MAASNGGMEELSAGFGNKKLTLRSQSSAVVFMAILCLSLMGYIVHGKLEPMNQAHAALLEDQRILQQEVRDLVQALGKIADRLPVK
jgi:hypothetical protein